MVIVITAQYAEAIIARLRLIAAELEEVASRGEDSHDRFSQQSLAAKIRVEASNIEQCIR